MSVTQPTAQEQQSDSQRCKQCNAIIPPSATFCGKCGEKISSTNGSSRKKQIIADRYRITSLIRRQSAIKLSFAFDTHKQCPVVIRDITISNLDETTRAKANAALQHEHYLLNTLNIPDIMPISALHNTPDHLYSIASQPAQHIIPESPEAERQPTRITTLQDLLQSGIGLPEEGIAVAWIVRIAETVACLHEQDIVIGTLDPHIIISSAADYSGSPALMPAWMPGQMRQFLPAVSTSVNTRNFSAPEVLQGQADTRSDVYSLAAILYLLLTGQSPTPAAAPDQPRAIARLRDFNSRLSSALENVVTQALASDPNQRIQSPRELAEALRQPENWQSENKQDNRRISNPFARQAKSVEQVEQNSEEIASLSDKNNKETGKRNDAHAISEATDETVRIMPLPAHHAQRYLSRIQNQKQSTTDEQQSGEAMAKNAPAQEEQTGDVTGQNEKVKISGQVAQDLVEDHTLAESTEVEPIDQTVSASSDPVPSITEQDASKAPEAQESSSPDASEHPTETLAPGEVQPVAQVEAETATPPAIEDVATVIVTNNNNTEAQPEQATSEKTATLPKDGPITEKKARKTRQSEKSDSPVADLPTHLLSQEMLARPNENTRTGKTTSQEQARQKEETSETTPPAIYDIPTVRISLAETLAAAQQQREAEAAQAEEEEQAEPEPQDPQAEKGEATNRERTIERIKGIVTGKLPAIPRLVQSTAEHMPNNLQKIEAKTSSLLRRVKRFVLGEQQHRTSAAALIETPMRIQPNQNYAIRIHIMGRVAPRDGEEAAGLSALIQDDIVHIEVRSALYQNYAYIVQQADVAIPASGYAAEVNIPMRPLAKGPSSRRERLHIFFMDAERNPLYEKPFVIELFISPLVQAGREGHNVLSIPL